MTKAMSKETPACICLDEQSKWAEAKQVRELAYHKWWGATIRRSAHAGAEGGFAPFMNYANQESEAGPATRRRSERKEKTVRLIVQPLWANHTPAGPAVTAVTRDICAQGVGILTVRPPKTDLLRIQLAEFPKVKVIGRVRHSGMMTSNESMYLSGIEYLDESTQPTSGLKNFAMKAFQLAISQLPDGK